jgi:hypothetical protein
MKKNIFDRSIFEPCEGSIPSPTPTLPQDRIDQGLPVNAANDGPMHTRVPQPRVIYDKAENEKVISKENAYIVFGTDRPSTKASGFGGQGAISDTIDIVVGRLASGRGGKGPCDEVYTGNNFAADAARIYISRLTDLDTNFGVATDKLAEPFARSGIAIKADHVRIIGREGVKIVTGGMQGVTGYGLKGETNSRGGRLSQGHKIDLLAGNNTGTRRVWGGLFNPIDKIEYLQPITKGDNMVRCLEELSEVIDNLLAAILNLAIMTTMGFSSIAVAASANPFTLNIAPAPTPAITLIGSWVTAPTYQTRVKKTNWETNYLNSNAHRYICSRNVRAT